MKTALAFLVAGLVACGSVDKHDPRLDGVWVSDRDKTLAQIDDMRVSAERLGFLREHLGGLRYCFSGNRTASYFGDSSEVQLNIYSVAESTPSSVTVAVGIDKVGTFYFGDECIHHEVPGWGYKEYFCRRPGVQNPCE